MRVGTLLRTRLDQLRNERGSRAQLEAVQLAKFRRLVHFAQARSPYYARLIAERRIDVLRCTPEHFPVLTKRDLAEHFDDLVTDKRVTRRAQKQLDNIGFRLQEMDDLPVDARTGKFLLVVRPEPA